jgi:hypothetical protein
MNMREDIVFVGRIKDTDGFPCDLLENPHTGARYLAYEPEVHWQKAELAKLRATRPQKPKEVRRGRKQTGR